MLIFHWITFYIWLNCLHCLLFCIKGYITRRIINPLYFKMRVCMKIVSYFLIRHIIDSKQVPCIVTNFCCVLSKIRVFSLIKEFYIISVLLSWSFYTLMFGKNLSVRYFIFLFLYWRSWMSDSNIPSKYYIFPVSDAFLILYIL